MLLFFYLVVCTCSYFLFDYTRSHIVVWTAFRSTVLAGFIHLGYLQLVCCLDLCTSSCYLCTSSCSVAMLSVTMVSLNVQNKLFGKSYNATVHRESSNAANDAAVHGSFVVQLSVDAPQSTALCWRFSISSQRPDVCSQLTVIIVTLSWNLITS